MYECIGLWMHLLYQRVTQLGIMLESAEGSKLGEAIHNSSIGPSKISILSVLEFCSTNNFLGTTTAKWYLLILMATGCAKDPSPS